MERESGSDKKKKVRFLLFPSPWEKTNCIATNTQILLFCNEEVVSELFDLPAPHFQLCHWLRAKQWGEKKKSSAHDTALFEEVNILQSCEADDVNNSIM